MRFCGSAQAALALARGAVQACLSEAWRMTWALLNLAAVMGLLSSRLGQGELLH